MPAFHHPKLPGVIAATTLAAFALATIGCGARESSVRPQADAARAPEIVREDLKFPIEKDVSTVEIVNPLGEISVRNREEAEVAVHGVVQQLPPDFGRARIVSSREGDVLRLAVMLPEGSEGGRYDMAVYAPSGLPLILKGTAGRVDARKRTAPLTVTTTAGNINASTESWMDVTTDSGSIKAIARGENWVGRTRVRSNTGRILVLVPLSGDVSLNAQTGGRLTTNFGLSVQARDGGGSIASARYGSGTSELSIASESGEVILEQAILLEQDGG